MKVKRLFMLSVLALLVLTGCSLNEKAESVTNESEKQHLNITQADLIASITDNEKYLNPDLIYDLETLDESDSISVIITLDAEGVFDSYIENARGYDSVGTYATSNYGIYEKNKMIEKQKEVIESLKSSGLIEGVNHSYTTLFNGFSAQTTYGKISKLQKVAQVSRVTISEVYAKPQSTTGGTGAVTNVVDVYETGIFNSSGLGYTGDNTAVAILDSGFDVHHTVFQNMPNQPMIAKEDVNAILANTKASGYKKGLIVEDVYLNAKIPYAYDYADKDPDVAPYDSNHGTHVAGIIGGNDDVITGVAVNTQLVLMKVFGDINNGAETEDILAALEDAVTLGVDAINLSLGSSCGFSRSSDDEYINEVYDKIEAAGISMVVAASNDYNSAYGGAESNTNKASNPDSASVGSPGTYTTALSVASISGVKSKYITTEDGYVFFFNEASTAGTEQYDFYEMLYEQLDKQGKHFADGEDIEIEYVTVPGIGKKVNYSNIDVKGKIALVKRGETSFNEKAQMAYEAGAIGCIIYNNLGGEIYMSAGNDLKIPFCSISKDDGEYLAKHSEGVLVLNNANQAGPFMSDFSSWGPNPDLSLKPEITAHGGTITSSVPGGGYDEISGTSMACPNLCGVVILVRQYLKERYPEKSSVEILKMTNQLLMSTTTIALDKSGNPYSPRKQGSGLANLKAALETQAYITVGDTDKTKIELGDDKEETGIYKLEFTINNLSNQALTYTLDDFTMTESLSTANKEFVAEKAYLLNPTTTISVSGSGSLNGNDITVDGNGNVTVTYTIKLSNADKKYMRESFENGMYIEGFATLDSKNSDNIDLSVPFLAFFGDWTVAPLFDKTYFEVESEAHNAAIDEEDKIKADYYATTPLGTYYHSYVIPLGTYLYEMDEEAYDPIPASEEHAAMGYNLETINGITTVYAGLLRNAKKMTTTIANSVTGEVVYEHVRFDQVKAHYSGGQVPAYDLLTEDEKITAAGLGLENNTKYTFKMVAELDYGDGGLDTNLNNTFEFDFYVDFEAPIMTDAEFYAKYDKSLKENRYYVDVYVYDNHYAQAIRPFTLVNGEICSFTKYPIPIYSEKGEVSKVTIEITDYMDLLQYGSGEDYEYLLTNGLGFCIDDYAINQNYYFVTLPGTNSDSFQFVDENGERITDLPIKVGEQIDLTEMIKSDDETYNKDDIGQSEYFSKLSWKSSNEKVLRVNGGIIEGVNAGNAIITATTMASDGFAYKVSLNVRVRGKGSVDGDGNVQFTNDAKLEDLQFTYFDTLEAFLDGPEFSEIGETGDRTFFVNKPVISCYPSERVQLGYEITPWNLDPSRYELIWASTNEGVATVDENGVVTAMKEGSANITLRIKVDGKLSSLIARARVVVKSEFVIENRVLTAYKGWGGDVVIPDDEGIMYIGAFAFALYTTDYEIEIPEDDQHAGKTAGGNTTVTSVVIPYDVMEVQNFAFYNCTALESVTFVKGPKGDTCKILRNSAFEGCISLKDINTKELQSDKTLKQIPLEVEVMGRRCFAKCSSLETIDFSHAYALGRQAFADCEALKSIDLTTVRSAGEEVFLNCSNLKEVINGKYTKFSEGMFKNSGLESLVFNADRIPNKAFIDCKELEEVIIASDILYVGSDAFNGCSSLTNVKFEGSCDYIFANAFKNSTNLATLTLPNSPVEIEEYAFDNCGSLLKVIFNENTLITKNAGSIFNNCGNLQSFESLGTNYQVRDNLLLSSDGKTIILAAGNYNYGNYTIPNGIESIADGAFSGIDTLTEINFNEVSKVGKYAFAECDNLETVNLPTSGLEVLDGAFANCDKLTTVNNLDTLDYFAPYVFAKSKLTNITLENNTVIDEGAFSNTLSLTSVTLGDNTTIGVKAFAGNTQLESVVLGNNTIVDSYAFNNCSKLNTIDLSKVVGALGAYAFSGAKAIKEANLANVTSVGDYAFSDAISLEKVMMPKVEFIGEYAFATTNEAARSANALSQLTLPNTLKSIGRYAFYKNNYLETVSIGDGISKIGEYAFSECAKLTDFVALGVVEIIEECTFGGDTALETVQLNGVKKICDAAFYNNTALVSIDLSTVLEVGYCAFENCTSLKELNLLEVVILDDGAFRNNQSVTKVVMPKVEVIGIEALSNLSVSTITLPNTVHEVRPMAFYNNKNQTSFTYQNETELVETYEINDYMLISNGVLYTKTVNNKYLLSSYPTGKTDTTYEVINKVVRIEYAAAENNPYLEKVTLPETLKLIGNRAFYGCSKLDTVEFKSTIAPSFEGTITGSIEYAEDSEILELLTKYFPLNGYYPLYYGQFVTLIGLNTKKLNIIIPKNKNVSGYDNILYGLYFDLETMEKSKYTALDHISIEFLDKINLVPEVVNLNDKLIIEDARRAYNALKQDLTDFGYTKDEVLAMEALLVSAESQYKNLMTQRINKIYGYLIEEINELGPKYQFNKIADFHKILGDLNLIDKEDKKYIDTTNVEKFQEEYQEYFTNLREEVAVITQISTLPTSTVNKVGLVVANVTLGLGGLGSMLFFIFKKRWFI